MTRISFACDRCGSPVEGEHTEIGTAGFYVVDPGKAFGAYGREGEHFVCESCVQSMPEYQRDYGPPPPRQYLLSTEVATANRARRDDG